MTRTLEAKLLLKGDDKTGKATGSAARGLENVAKTAKRAEDAWKRASAAQRAMAANVRSNAREVERLQRGVQVQADRHVQQIKRINGAIGRLRSGAGVVDAAILGVSRYVAPIAAVTAATDALNNYAEAVNSLERIGITGDADDKTMAVVGKQVRSIAQDVALPIDTVTGGLDTLVSAGKTVEEAMAMLPAVASAAQASNSDIRDIAASAVAVGESFDIAADKMERAFDVMAHGGKLGKFELKDMAQYLPSLAPLAATQGYTGEEGLKRVVAMLQVVRSQTGRAENAAVGLSDLLTKMETDETANKFENFGVDIRAWMENARKQGQDTVLAFLDAINKAIGEDYTKLPQLIGDKESRTAALALITQRPQLEEYVGGLGNAEGTVGRDLLRLTDNLEQGFQRVKNAVDLVGESAGKMVASFGVPEGILKTTEMLKVVAAQLDEIANRRGGFFSDQGPFREGGPLGKGSTFNKVVGTEGYGYAGIVGAYTDLMTGASGEPGDFYNSVMSEWMAAGWKAAKDFAVGELPVPVPAPAPGRPPAASAGPAASDARFQMQPSDLKAPIVVGDYSVPLGRPEKGVPAASSPWDAYTLPRGRPGPEALAAPIPATAVASPAPSGPGGLPFQMRADDPLASIVAAAGPLPQAVESFVGGLDAAGDAAAHFRMLVGGGGPDWPRQHASEMSDDELLKALSGEPTVAEPVPARGDGTLGSGGVFRTEAQIDGIGAAADEAAGKLAALPSAMPVGEMGAAGRQGAEAFTSSFGQALVTGVRTAFAGAEAEARAGAARLGAAASVSVNPRVSRGASVVDADRGASMPNISERLP